MSALESSVLVLNSGYTAVRITNARRAFILLIRDAAEVVTTDAGQFQTYDLAAWILWSELVRTGTSPRRRKNVIRPIGYIWSLRYRGSFGCSATAAGHSARYA